jgi:predicted RNA-binding protein (virulence factor B family)
MPDRPNRSREKSAPSRVLEKSNRQDARQATLELGQVGFLRVTDVVPFGAFMDWGLPKDLLVPLAEQLDEMEKGETYPVGVIEDDQGRLTGTQRIAALLREPPPFVVDDWVSGEAWRNDPRLGVFVIVEKRYLGLLPQGEPHNLTRGSVAKFRVSQVLIDGKIQLSLRRRAVEEFEDDAQRVLTRLTQGNIRVSDATDPAVIRAQFGLSKKAYKRAVGRLLKQGVVRFDDSGYVIVSGKP